MTPLTQSEINKYITEKALNQCWHEELYSINDDTVILCPKCGDKVWTDVGEHINPDFSQWEHYGPMIRKCMEKEWWGEFRKYIYLHNKERGEIFEILFNPALGSRAIVEFLKEKNG